MCLKPKNNNCGRNDFKKSKAGRPRLNLPSRSATTKLKIKSICITSIRQLLKSPANYPPAPDFATQNTRTDIQSKLLTTEEQYQHPLWQQKCMTILERDKYKCQSCGATGINLHVYLLNPKPKGNIWEEDEDSLKTVCSTCRGRLDSELPKLSGILGFKILSGEIDPLTLFQLP